MNKIVLNVAFLGFVALEMASCVPKRKLVAAQYSIDSLNNQYNGLNGRYGQLNSNYDDVKSRLALMEDANNKTNQELDSTSQQLGQREQALQQQQEHLKRLQELIDQQNAKTEEIRKKMAAALGNFNTDQLTVTTKDGKVYVSMQEKLLFPSGSADVNADGKQALQQLAEALNANKDINIVVSGNTDSVPIKYKFEDNWALSVARATAITRVLINDYAVDPARITAAGRSQYDPVADNTTPEGRAKNRRTDIILAPKLDELAKLIGTDK